MVALAPPLVVDVVVVVAGGGDAHLEELVVGLAQERRGGHETTTGVAVDAHPFDVDVRMPGGQLLQAGLLVGQAVVAQVEVAVDVVGLRAGRRAAAVAQLNDDEADLRQLLPAV